MKKLTTRLLYVFSFSLLFTALYLNFVQKDKENSFHAEGNLSPATLTGSSAVATPENTVLK